MRARSWLSVGQSLRDICHITLQPLWPCPSSGHFEKLLGFTKMSRFLLGLFSIKRLWMIPTPICHGKRQISKRTKTNNKCQKSEAQTQLMIIARLAQNLLVLFWLMTLLRMVTRNAKTFLPRGWNNWWIRDCFIVQVKVIKALKV